MTSDPRVPEFDGSFASIDPAEFDAALIGLTLSDARAFVRAAGWDIRVAEDEGGGSGLVTLDMRPNRINVAITDGAITRVMYNG